VPRGCYVLSGVWQGRGTGSLPPCRSVAKLGKQCSNAVKMPFRRHIMNALNMCRIVSICTHRALCLVPPPRFGDFLWGNMRISPLGCIDAFLGLALFNLFSGSTWRDAKARGKISYPICDRFCKKAASAATSRWTANKVFVSAVPMAVLCTIPARRRRSPPCFDVKDLPWRRAPATSRFQTFLMSLLRDPFADCVWIYFNEPHGRAAAKGGAMGFGSTRPRC